MIDLRFALRQLAKSPAFTAMAILTLTLGIGSAAITFSAVNALLLKPLPFVSPDIGLRLLYTSERDTIRRINDLGWTLGDYHSFRAQASSFEALWLQHDRTVILAGQGVPERHVGTELSWDAFARLQIAPVHGRPFTAADAEKGAAPVALISHGLWQRKFGGKLDILGKPTRLNGEPTTIIGIMPKGWMYPERSDIWTPFRADGKLHAERGTFFVQARALLKPGVTLDAAQQEADVIFKSLADEFPATNTGIVLDLKPLRERAIAGTDRYTLLLFGGVMFVFLIACVNVANLLLARGVTRAKEFAVRLALGAPQGRLVRQLAAESVLLALLGGAGGLIYALWGVDAMVASIPVEIPFWLQFDVDARVCAFVFALSLIAAGTFGFFPALRTTTPDVLAELKEGGRSCECFSPRTIRLRNGLVAAEIALALVLLVSAGLMLRSFFALRGTEAGFNPRGVFTFRTGYPPSMVDAEARIPRQFFAALLPKLAALPGVENVGLVATLPGTSGTMSPIVIEGTPTPERMSEAAFARARSASADYFATLRIPLKTGRLFDDTLDGDDTARVALVDEAFAQRYFGSNEQAVGKRVQLAKGSEEKSSEPKQIIGVVGNVRHRLEVPEYEPTVYSPHLQDGTNFMSVVLRTRADPASYETLVRHAVLRVDPNLPIYHPFTLEEVLLRNDYIWQRKFFGYLFATFGGIALFLACIGIYGVMSYNVTQRAQELGVRMALGAQPRHVIQLVIRQGLTLIGWGLGLGMIAAVLLTNLLTGLLYGVSPHDPPTFAAVPLLLATVAFLACWLPGHRATRIEPNIALRFRRG